MVTVASLAEANKVHADFAAVITAGPRLIQINWRHPNHIVRSFYDVTDRDARGAATEADVRAMLAFGAGQDSVLVHCHRGESRSTAIAIGLLVQAGATPTEAMHTLRSAHPVGRAFTPNPLVLGHIEAVLGSAGLVAEVARLVPTAGVLLPMVTTRRW